MGGLIAHYAVIKYPHIFSRAGVFSPSFWMNDSIFTDTRDAGHPYPMRIYLLAGGNEGGGMVPKAQAMYDTLMQADYAPDEVHLHVVPTGQHSEWFWRQEFPAAYQWLFREATSETSESMGAYIDFSPNPAHGQIRATHVHGKARLDLYNMMGMPVMHAFVVEGDLLDITVLPEGIYLMRIEEDGNVYYERFVKD
jgi:metallo-beta-lactamase class B